MKQFLQLTQRNYVIIGNMQECVYWYNWDIFYIYTIVICNFQLTEVNEFFQGQLGASYCGGPMGRRGCRALATALTITKAKAKMMASS